MARTVQPPSLEQRIERLELAVGTAMWWLSQSTDFSQRAAIDIEGILRGTVRKPRKKMPKEKIEDGGT